MINPVFVVQDRTNDYNAPVIIHLIRIDGSQENRFQLLPHVQVIAVAGQRIFVVSGTHLKGVRRDGSVEDLTDLGSDTATVVVNPSGTMWLWGTYSSTPAANGNVSFHSQVHLGGDGISSRVVDDVVEVDHVLRPYAWTSGGVFVAHGGVGIGGYIPFSAPFGPVDRLDPTTWKATADVRTNNCGFSDERADGLLACFAQAGASVNQGKLNVLGASGAVVSSVALPKPAFTLFGEARFSPDGKSVAVGGAAGVGFQPGEQFSTETLVVGSSTLSPVAVSGVRPWGWLSDGRLVVYRPAGAAGGAAGVYVIDPHGQATFVPANNADLVGIFT